MTKTNSWTTPSTPIPRTLPISRSRARTVESTTSTTRLCFSSTTPVRTVKPKLKMPTRISTAPMLANRKRAWSASVCGWSAPTVGGCCAAASAPWSTLLWSSVAWTRRPTIAVDRLCAIDWSGSLSNLTVPAPDRSAGIATTTSTLPSSSAASAVAASGNVVIATFWSKRAAALVIAPGRASGAGSTTPTLVVVRVAEQEGRHDERADDDQRGEEHAEDEPAAAPALEDLAPGHQPDAPPAWHHATSRAGASGATASMNSSDSRGGW